MLSLCVKLFIGLHFFNFDSNTSERFDNQNTNQTQATIPSSADNMTSSSQLISSASMESDNACAHVESDQGQEDKCGIEGQARVLRNDGASPARNERGLASRLSYNTGHGDFCFSRLVDWQKYHFDANNEEEKLWCMGITGSNGVPVVELGGFQRYSTSVPSHFDSSC